MLTSSVVPVILPVALKLAGQSRFGGSEIAHRQRPPQIDLVRRHLPARLQRRGATREPQARQVQIIAAQRRGKAEPAIVADHAAGLRLPAGDRNHAIGGERGGVAVDRGMQVQHKVALQRHLTHRRERRQVGEPQRGVNASPLAGQRVRIGGEQTMAQRDVHRSVRRVQFDVGLDCQRIAGEQVRVWTRHVQSRHLAVQPKLPRVAGDVGGEPVDAEAGRGQRVDVQAAGSIGAAEGAAHMRVDRHCLPADVRSRLHGGRSGRYHQVGGFVLEVERAANGGVHGAGGQRRTGDDRVTWSVETRIDRHRAQVGQPGQAGEQAMGRLAHVQRGLQPCGVGRGGHGIAARAIDLADVQAPAEIGRRGEFARTVQRDGSGGAGQCRTDVQPRNPQLTQDDRHRQARAAGGRSGRHPHRLDAGRLEPVDHDAPVQQLQRRPVERQVLDRGVGSLRVAQFDPRDAQRVGEPPGNAGEADRVAGHSSASAMRAPADLAGC